MPFAGNGNDCSPSCEDSSGKTNKSKSNDKACNSKDCSQWQRTYEINENLDVILQGRIGEGFYGEVYIKIHSGDAMVRKLIRSRM